MKTQAVVAVLFLAGCTKNQAELDAALSIVDRQLAESQERADRLNELRREVDALEARVQALAATPEQQAALKTAREKAHPASKRAPFIAPTLPAESPLEGAEGAQRRRQIAETQARIAMLKKILVEIDLLEARRDELLADLAQLERVPGK